MTTTPRPQPRDNYRRTAPTPDLGQPYVVRCESCGLSLPVTGSFAAARYVSEHKANTTVCAEIGIYAEPAGPANRPNIGRKRARRA